MAKLKTIKAVAKRFKVTKKKKLMKKTTGQGHFNSREPGKVTRNKRRLGSIAKTNEKSIKNALPYLNK